MEKNHLCSGDETTAKQTQTQKHFFGKVINYTLRHLSKLFNIQLLNPKLQ